MPPLTFMALVVLAANALTFLVAWERMSLRSCVLVATAYRARATRQSALICLGATRVGTAYRAGAFLWAHARTSSWALTDWHLVGLPSLRPGLRLLGGLGVQAGRWPFHRWLLIA